MKVFTLVVCLATGAVACTVATTALAAPSAPGPSEQSRETDGRAAAFTDTLVASVAQPTAFTWTPDGRLLVTTKPGRLRVSEGPRTSVALDLSSRVCSEGERGLLGVAVDPDFATNHYIYLYYTHRVGGACREGSKPYPESRVGRFELSDDGVASPSTETVIVDHLASPREHHLAGDLEFGTDELLYISVGDGICSLRRASLCGPVNDNAQLRSNPLGKVLRVDRDGRPAEGNPYAGRRDARRCTRPSGVPPGTGPCAEIFALGFRNPFRFARMPGTSTFYVDDVGLDTWEEIDHLHKGGNYGWNVREGHCARDSVTRCGAVPRFRNPIHDYRHGRCRSITGGAFVPRGLWSGFDDSYLFSDFTCGKIFRLTPDPAGGFERTVFPVRVHGPTHLRFGPYLDTSALYYASFFDNQVRRIALASQNTPPVAQFIYTPDGRVIALDGAPSSDPDGQKITSWRWSFGDGTSTTTTGPRVSHTYDTTGPFHVNLTVADEAGLESAPVTRTVYSGEHPPSIQITAPAATARFRVGQVVTLAATASDQEDGTLPGSSITWRVRLHHANHFHPQAGPASGASLTTTYPPPEELAATTSSWLVATARATDSHGLSTVAKQQLLPKKVTLSFDSAPPGARLVVEGVRRAAPFSVTSWAGHVFRVNAPDQRLGGHAYVFVRWSDDGARTHDIETPVRPREYRARFARR